MTDKEIVQALRCCAKGLELREGAREETQRKIGGQEGWQNVKT